MFKLVSKFIPTGDQPQAIEKLVAGIKMGLKDQVLIGVTGSGKTFTIANIIEKTNLPTLIISHNKTLAGQLYQEFRDFFPENAVSYFVSYYDYYQPEAYIPTTDTYIEKEAQINEMIDKLRLKSTTNLLTRKDVIVISSVSSIYNIGSSIEYGRFILEVKIDQDTTIKDIIKRLVELRYERSEFDFKRGTFRVRGDRVDIYPPYDDFGYRVVLESGKIKEINKFEPISGREIKSQNHHDVINKIIIYPGKHYMTDPDVFSKVEKQIRADLQIESNDLKKKGKLLEAERLIRKVNYDLEMLKEVGYVNGIENYSRYFDGRKKGDPPYALVDYFNKQYGDNWLLFIDESHMTVPQLKGMYNGDFSRKNTLIEFGFRLKAALDNRPLRFDELYKSTHKIVYVSATPDEWELNQARVKDGQSKLKGIVEQLIRPTGIIDPEIFVKPAVNQVVDLIKEIKIRVNKKEKILVTTLTKKNAEDLTDYLKENNIKAEYLHSDIKTLERSNILDNLRKGEYDVLIGVNLLREGLDLPEVSLVAVLDADSEGFLRSKTSLIQTMGRAARNIKSEVILYADKITDSIKESVSEINRRREYQKKYNIDHKITPKTIIKPIREKIIDIIEEKQLDFKDINLTSLTPFDRKKLTKKLEGEMRKMADSMNFEKAIEIRDQLKKLNN